MNRETFAQLIAGAPALEPHAGFLLGLLRPCVRIAITSDGPNGTASQLGGKPMVPTDFEWPQHEVGVYRFLGQINFSEIAERPPLLPGSGLLSLFYAEYDPESDGEEEIFWGDEGYVRAWYFEDLTALTPMAPPRGQAVPARRITLAGELDLPRDRYMRPDWPFDFDAMDEVLGGDDPSGMPLTPPDALLPTDYLLGYPSYYSLGYNPTPGPDWVSLLTLHSHDAFDWCWQDGNKLMVFIEHDRLAACDFNTLRCDAG